MRFHTAETQSTMTPYKAAQFLKEGNMRFVQNLKMNRNHLDMVGQYKDGQYPFAVVLSCMDSRTTTELIFDQGLGDVFSIRIAGNILNDDIIGSMEYACQIAGAKLILVLGHSKCGAVSGACAGKKVGRLTQLLQKLDVSIQEVKSELPKLSVASQAFADKVAQHNVMHTMDEILNRSAVLTKLYEEKQIGLAGAFYNIDTGQVEFLKEDFVYFGNNLITQAV